MAPVAMNLATSPKDDVKAIATYVAALGKARHQDQPENASHTAGGGGAQSEEGAAIYAGACASCHEGSRPLPYGGLNFKLSTAVSGPNPVNIVNVTLFGLGQQPGSAGAVMPGFRGSLTDRQMLSLLSYLRGRFSSKPPWPTSEQEIRVVRDNVPRLWPAPGVRPMVANSSQEVRPW